VFKWGWPEKEQDMTKFVDTVKKSEPEPKKKKPFIQEG